MGPAGGGDFGFRIYDFGSLSGCSMADAGCSASGGAFLTSDA
jgi:hypothetical protein